MKRTFIAWTLATCLVANAIMIPNTANIIVAALVLLAGAAVYRRVTVPLARGAFAATAGASRLTWRGTKGAGRLSLRGSKAAAKALPRRNGGAR